MTEGKLYGFNGFSGVDIKAGGYGWIRGLHVDDATLTGKLVFIKTDIDDSHKIFDIIISAANEYGDLYQMKLLHVKLLGTGPAEEPIEFKCSRIIPWELITSAGEVK